MNTMASTDFQQDAPVGLELEQAPAPTRRLRRLAGALFVYVKAIVGVGLCYHYVTSWIVVGWLFRLMRLRIWKGWWRVSPQREQLSWNEFVTELDPKLGTGPLPNWIVAERGGEVLRRPLRDGSKPGLGRRLVRIPKALLGGLGRNAAMAIVALFCTYVLTLPGLFLWEGSWYDGWNNSFTKGYEQAAVGPLTGLLGSFLFIVAMMYVPMAWGHLAATGDPRAFFEFGFVSRLIRHRLAATTWFAALFSLATIPIQVFRLLPVSFTNGSPALETLDPTTFQQILSGYILVGGAVAFVLAVIVHLLAARMYRKAVLRLLERDPSQVHRLHPRLFAALSALALLPAAPPRRRHPLVAVVLGTGRRGVNAVLWVATFLLWFSVVAQIYIAQFFDYIPFIGWMNQPLVHLPSLYLFAAGPG